MPEPPHDHRAGRSDLLTTHTHPRLRRTPHRMDQRHGDATHRRIAAESIGVCPQELSVVFVASDVARCMLHTAGCMLHVALVHAASCHMQHVARSTLHVALLWFIRFPSGRRRGSCRGLLRLSSKKTWSIVQSPATASTSSASTAHSPVSNVRRITACATMKCMRAYGAHCIAIPLSRSTCSVLGASLLLRCVLHQCLLRVACCAIDTTASGRAATQ